jgi:hypothetical protein
MGAEGVEINTYCELCGQLVVRSWGDGDEDHLAVDSEWEFVHNAGITYDQYMGIGEDGKKMSREEYEMVRKRELDAVAAGFVDPLPHVPYDEWSDF